MFTYNQKKLLCVLFLSWLPHQSLSLDAQSMGRGFTGVSFNQSSSASLYNPALISHETNENGFDIMLSNFSLSVSAQQETLDAFEDFDENDYFSDISDVLDELNDLENLSLDDFNEKKANLTSNTDAVIAHLLQLDEKPVSVDLSNFIAISFSNETIGLSFFTGISSLKLEVLPDINECDLQVLNTYTQFINNDIDADNRIMPNNAQGSFSCEGEYRTFNIIKDGEFSDPLNDTFYNGSPLLDSRIEALAVNIFETGLSISHRFDFDEVQFSLGVTPKFLEIHSLYLRHTVKDIEEDLIDLEESYKNNRNKRQDFNLDLGIAIALFHNDLTFGLSGKNIIYNSYNSGPFYEKYKSDTGDIMESTQFYKKRFAIHPQWLAGASYRWLGLTAAIDIDLTKRKPFFSGMNNQFVSMGIEYNIANIIALRLGTRIDLLGETEEQLTTGLTLGNRTFHIDLGAQVSNEVASAGFQLGFGF